MKPRSRAADALPRSGIREMMTLAATMEDVIHLEVGEPSFDTAPHIIDTALADARAGHTRYTSNAGIPSLRSAIAERVSAKWGRPVGADEVLVTHGTVAALAVLTLALVDRDEEILVPDPGWPNYRAMAALAGARVVPYELRPEDGWVPDVAHVASRVTARTKALILNTPANPTGAVLPAEVVGGLVRLAEERDLYVVSDEVYEDLVFEGAHASAGPLDRERVFVVSGFSKSYAMTGWRVGYAIAPPDLVELMAKIVEPLYSCPSSVSQRAAEAALRGPQDAVVTMRGAYRKRRDLVVEAFRGTALLPVVPRGAFYAMVDLRHLGLGSRDLSRQLLLQEKVATAPGDAFGECAGGMLRISLATADDLLREGCARIRAFARRHNPAVVPAR